MANENLNQQNAIAIIGANGGIGHALLQELPLTINASYFPTYNSSPPLDTAFQWLKYNSLDQVSVDDYFTQLAGYDLTAIIDCSGAFFASSLVRASEEEMTRIISTNLIGPFNTAKKSLTSLAPNGKLIFMSSVLVNKDVYGSSIYAASKAGLEKAISTLGQEFRKKDLAICGIRLDYMDYGMTHKINENVKKTILDSMPNQEFIKINVLTEIIQSIIEKDSADISGRTFSLGEKPQ